MIELSRIWSVSNQSSNKTIQQNQWVSINQIIILKITIFSTENTNPLIKAPNTTIQVHKNLLEVRRACIQTIIFSFWEINLELIPYKREKKGICLKTMGKSLRMRLVWSLVEKKKAKKFQYFGMAVNSLVISTHLYPRKQHSIETAIFL